MISFIFLFFVARSVGRDELRGFLQRNSKEAKFHVNTLNNFNINLSSLARLFQCNVTRSSMQVRSAGARDFMWVFSTFQQGDAVTDVARIFNVKITNTLDTGAVGCRDCPRGATANAQ